MHRQRRRVLATTIVLLLLVVLRPGATPLPACNVLFGVAANPLTRQVGWDAALHSFESKVGRNVDVAHFYRHGQSDMFPAPSELSRAGQPGDPLTLFYNWRPDGLTWRQVADGAADPYLHRLSDYIAQNAHAPFFLSISAEMESKVDNRPGSGQSTADFHDYFRHVVQVLRSNPATATKVVTVMDYTGAAKWAAKAWFPELYPGDDVVDWIAQDPYAYDLAATPDLASLVNQPSGDWPGFYNWAATTHPDKPQMLAEWGVSVKPHDPGPSAAFFERSVAQLAGLPHLRALVYWNHSGVSADGDALKVGTTNVGASPQVLAAFRTFVTARDLESPEPCRISGD